MLSQTKQFSVAYPLKSSSQDHFHKKKKILHKIPETLCLVGGHSVGRQHKREYRKCHTWLEGNPGAKPGQSILNNKGKLVDLILS